MTNSPVGATEEFPIRSVEGLPLPDGVRAQLLLRGEHGLMLRVQVARGVKTPLHSHAHDSLLYVLSGHVRATVDDVVTEIHAGDAVLHPAGSPHISEAIEDSVWLEVKAPPEVTW